MSKEKEEINMEMTYGGALVMPSSYAMMDEEEMMYLDGGLNLDYKWYYQDKIGAAIGAAAIKEKYNWNNISTFDLAAEIFTHAIAYYDFGLLLAVAKGLGFATSIANSILGGIDVENKLDTKTICGVKRYYFYRAIYAAF